MTEIEQYLGQLQDALHTRGRARRRLIAECRDHLLDASSVHGGSEAVRRFGSAAALARAYDTEILVRRAVRSTGGAVAGVLALGGSVLALADAADPTASAVPAWAIVFFTCAQAAAVCLVSAGIRAAAMWERPGSPAEVVLLGRRNGSALAFGLMTLFAAGAAVPGHGSVLALLLGPAIAVAALLAVWRTSHAARRLGPGGHRTVSSPLADLRLLTHRPAGPVDSVPRARNLVPIALAAGLAAFLWDHFDRGTVASSTAAAAVEVGLTIVGFLLLGPMLGLRVARR